MVWRNRGSYNRHYPFYPFPHVRTEYYIIMCFRQQWKYDYMVLYTRCDASPLDMLMSRRKQYNGDSLLLFPSAHALDVPLSIVI